MKLTDSEWKAIRDDLLSKPGVRAVLLGEPRRGGKWQGERAICVHVERKVARAALPDAARIPERYGDLKTDVLGVGAARVHGFLDTRDGVLTSYDAERRSTLTATFEGPDGVIAIGSGHALLPYTSTGFTPGPHEAGRYVIRAMDEDETYLASVVAGSVAGDLDYGVARFNADVAMSGHYHCAAPIPWTSAMPAPGTYLAHRPAGKSAIAGRVVQHEGAVVLDAKIPGASVKLRYAPVFAVRGVMVPFSRPGDSGSLLMDEDATYAVGVLVGGSEEDGISYGLPIAPLVRAVAQTCPGLFEEKEIS